MTHYRGVRQAGLSLVELMIAITLSSLLMLGVVQVFLSSKATYTSNQALSAIQESGRFAIELLARDIRNTGYKGQCLSVPANHLDNGANSLWSLYGEPLRGWDDGAPDFISGEVVTGSDILFIQFGTGGTDVIGEAGNSATNNTLALGSELDVPVASGDVVLISDGLGCDLFENTSVANNAVAKAGGGNWSYDYTGEFEVLTFQSLTYYVAEDEAGVSTLYRSRFHPGLTDEVKEALVPGVSTLKIEYGIASDGIVTDYVSASAVTSWADVAAVKLGLDVEASSGLKREFSTIVGLRNRLP